MPLDIIVDTPMVTAGHPAAVIAYLCNECLYANLQFIVSAAKATVIGRVACQGRTCPQDGWQNQATQKQVPT
jgi:hypothetical protein